jgi:hypothetical protein
VFVQLGVAAAAEGPVQGGVGAGAVEPAAMALVDGEGGDGGERRT